MKKLLFAIAGAAAFAASAADPAVGDNIDVLGFENFDLTNPNVTGAVINRTDSGVSGTSKWDCSGDDASTVKAYGGADAATAPSGITFPAPFDGAGDNYLALDTNGSELQRLIPAGSQTIAADGIYIDTLVQFTPSESAPTGDDLNGAKLAIWLGVDSEHNTTNLMVAGARYMLTTPGEDASLSFTTSTNYTLSGTYEPGTWYRLTVKAISSIAAVDPDPQSAQYLPGFVISIDGQTLNVGGPVTDDRAYEILVTDGGLITGDNKDLIDNYQFVPALGVSDPTIVPTLTAIGFKGTGALDDFVVTTNAPSASAGYPTYLDDADATIKAKYDTWKAGVGCDDATASQYQNQFLLNVDENMTVGGTALEITAITQNETAGWDITIGCSISGVGLTGEVGSTIVCNGYLAVSYTDDLTNTWTTENIEITSVDATAGTVTVNVNKSGAKFMKVKLSATAEPQPQN